MKAAQELNINHLWDLSFNSCETSHETNRFFNLFENTVRYIHAFFCPLKP